MKRQTDDTHTCPSQYMKREISQFCGIKQYTQTEKLQQNRPDIMIKNKKEKTCTLIDVAIPANRNVVKRKRERN